MKNADRVWRIIERAGELSLWKIDDLREHLAGFGCDEPPPWTEVEAVTGKMTRSDLIKSILSEEFDEETDTTQGWGAIEGTQP